MRVARTERTAHATPLWLLVMRSLIIGALILAAAKPVHSPETRVGGDGPILLIIDDGWAAAGDWDIRQQQASDLIGHR